MDKKMEFRPFFFHFDPGSSIDLRDLQVHSAYLFKKTASNQCQSEATLYEDGKIHLKFEKILKIELKLGKKLKTSHIKICWT